MSHLGDRVTALVDGQLPADAVERAHAHLACCRSCRDLVEAERLTKARLSMLQGPRPGVDLVQRLLTLGGPAGPMAPRDGHVPGTPRPAVLSRPHAGVAARSWGARPAGRAPVVVRAAAGTGPGRGRRRAAQRRTRIAVAVVGALSAVGVGISGLVISGTGTAGPTLVPPVDAFVVDHAAATSDLPFVDIPAGWEPSATVEVSGGAGK